MFTQEKNSGPASHCLFKCMPCWLKRVVKFADSKKKTSVQDLCHLHFCKILSRNEWKSPGLILVEISGQENIQALPAECTQQVYDKESARNSGQWPECNAEMSFIRS